ncbi:SH3 domain-containing protein [Amaricoccus macauensis]|uniref:SH3 domain-containing protein n=1 Tax=Amaricoccus macauensis TaxID=57001 RepID=UPI003C7CDDE8
MRLPLHPRAALVLLFTAILAPEKSDAQDVREERISLSAAENKTTVRGSLTGERSISYRLGAEAGQRLHVKLNAPRLSAYFNIYAPGSGPGETAMANSGLDGPLIPEINTFDAILPTSGEYVVAVYLLGAAARHEETIDFSLDVGLSGEIGGTVVADFADGLQGGPDFWEVDVSTSLNLRGAPSTGAAILTSLSSGQVLQNLGCRMAEGRRWCHVATPDLEIEGWVAGAFLVESSVVQDSPEYRVASGSASADQPATAFEDLRLSPGEPPIELQGDLLGGDAVIYSLGALRGQILTVDLSDNNEDIRFNIFGPDNRALYQSSDENFDGGSYRGLLLHDGHHKIAISSSAPRSETRRYAIEIALE